MLDSDIMNVPIPSEYSDEPDNIVECLSSTYQTNFEDEIKLYIITDKKMPIVKRTTIPPDQLTFYKFKQIAQIDTSDNKLYVRAHDPDFGGLVKEELIDDDFVLPTIKNRVIVWIVQDDCDFFNSNTTDEPKQTDRSLTPRSLYASCNFQSESNSTIVVDSNSIVRVDSNSRHGSTSLINPTELNLHCSNNDPREIYEALLDDIRSLHIRNREWLKLIIKNAFLGSSLTKWLTTNVDGFTLKSSAKKYANHLLQLGFIKDPMNRKKFSNKCYYTLNGFL